MSGPDSMVPAPRALSTPPTRPAPAAFPTAAIDEHVSDLLNLFDRGPKGPLQNDPLPVTSEQTVPAFFSPPTGSHTADRSSSKLDQGQCFLNWVKLGVQTHRLVINDAKAKVHSVDSTAFLVTPEIFRRYLHSFAMLT